MVSNKSLQSKIRFIAGIKYKIYQDLSSSFEICGWKADGHLLTPSEAFLILYAAHRRLPNRHCDSPRLSRNVATGLHHLSGLTVEHSSFMKSSANGPE
jgi:hypothetical protein